MEAQGNIYELGKLLQQLEASQLAATTAATTTTTTTTVAAATANGNEYEVSSFNFKARFFITVLDNVIRVYSPYFIVKTCCFFLTVTKLVMPYTNFYVVFAKSYSYSI